MDPRSVVRDAHGLSQLSTGSHERIVCSEKAISGRSEEVAQGVCGEDAERLQPGADEWMNNLRALLLFSVALVAFSSAHAQWEMQDSHTTSNLRGIHAVDAMVAWASGADGTILRTQDGGAHWQKCTIPPDGDK